MTLSDQVLEQENLELKRELANVKEKAEYWREQYIKVNEERQELTHINKHLQKRNDELEKFF